MNFKRLAAAIAALSASTAFAAPTFTVPGGQQLDPFGGIDWASNGTAFTTTFNQTAANSGQQFNFETTYFSYAVPVTGIQRPDGTNYFVPNLVGGSSDRPLAGTAPLFELTTVATFQETGQCTNNGANCDFRITGGSFDIYLDQSTNARTGGAANLNQYRDGTRIIGGNVTSGASNFTATPTGGTGSTSIMGVVTDTNNTFVTPNLVGTSATGTLQIGSAETAFERPGFLGANTCGAPGAGTAPRACTLVFQADSNQRFMFGQVPEPGTLALLGASMLGLGFGARRRTGR